MNSVKMTTYNVVALAVALDKAKLSENSNKLDKMCVAVELLKQANHNQVNFTKVPVTHRQHIA